MDLKKLIIDVPDFPKEGIIFKDITPVLGNPQAFDYVISQLFEHYHDRKIDDNL